MDVDTVKCRICWEVKETKGCVNLTTKWGTGSLKSIKDVILLCVPWMSIKDNSYLCRPCLWQLKFTYAFIERCLKTENILNEENNLDTVSLEEIFENTLRKGNKIQIIFENPANPQPLADIEVIAENTDDVATDVVATDDAAAANDADDAAAAADDDDDVIDLESVLESDSDVEHLRIKTRNYDAAIPLEHDYCIKKGALIHVDIINSQENNTTKSQQCNNMPIQNISSQQEKENVITIDDEVDNNDSDIFNDSTAQCNAVTNNSNFGGTNILQSYLTSKKKMRRSKTILTKRNCKPDIISKTSDPEQVKLDNELKDLLDMAPADIRFIVAHSEMSAEQQDKLVSDGVNILNISKDPSKRKRTIYLTRDYYPISTQCHRCNVPLITRCDYQDHHNMHKRGKINTPGEPIYTCKFCSETFTWDIDLRGHTKYHHGVSSPHYCPKCNKRYKTFKMLNDHMKQFQDQDKCVFSCKRCNKEFSKKYSLAQHEKDVADAPVCDYKKCKVCFEKFTKDDFKIHSTEVHPNCLCPECGKSFSENHLLSVHLKHVHNGEQSMCHQCGKIFVHPRSLEHHMETIHGNRKYICDKCPREFACQVYLKKHMIKHINEDKDISERKKWPCAHCEKAYVKKESLRLHEKTFHLMLDEDKFKCPICNEGHIRKDYLNRHIRSHEKYAKNTCTVCKKSFGTDWRLEYHMFAGHDENGKSLETGENRLQRPPSYKKKKPPKNTTAETLEDEYVEDVVCKVQDINENEMKTFELDEEKVLLVKQNGKISALGTKCTHYGAPLVNGALGDGRVRCQWHGACFNFATGDIEDFPALDALPCYKVTIENGNVRVRARKSELLTNKRTKDMVKKSSGVKERIVVIGGGPAGATCVEVLRQEGFQGDIVLVCKENYLPYDRVKVSKAMDFDITKAEFRDDKFYKENGIEVLKGVAATSVDTSENSVTLANGAKINYDKLFIATGCNPRKPKVPGGDSKNVLVLKDYDDSNYVYPLLNKEVDIVVLGSSFIGMEAANYCVDKVKSVTVIGRGAVPFRNTWGERIGSAILKMFEDKGVKYIANSGITKINSNDQGAVSSVELIDGQVLKCDILFSGIGSDYFTDFLKGSGVDIMPDGSIETNEFMQTNIPNVYAGGDIAYAPVWSYNNKKVAIGHYGLAHYHGKHAALKMLDKPEPLKTVPYFWTMLFGKGFRYAGHGNFDDIIYAGDVDKLKFMAYFLKDDEVVAVTSCGMDPLVSQFAERLAEGKKLYRNDLGDDPVAWSKSSL